ncbi:hypothetical protein D3C87_1846490 [compost metagenome]
MTRALVRKPTMPRPKGLILRPKIPSIIQATSAMTTAKNKALQKPPTLKPGTSQLVTINTSAATTNRITVDKKFMVDSSFCQSCLLPVRVWLGCPLLGLFIIASSFQILETAVC